MAPAERVRRDWEGDIFRKNLNRILKEFTQAKGYSSMSVQLTWDEVLEAYRSFFALRKKGFTQHNAPGFRRKSQLLPFKYVQSGFRVEKDRIILSLGTGREDGIKEVSFCISHRPGVEYEQVRELSITYDKASGRIEARMVVEVKTRENNGTGKVVVDLGEIILIACAFDDGTR